MSQRVFRASVESTDGLKVIGKSRNFEVIVDEPKSIGGSDEGMNPMELLLNSLGACQIITAKMFAKSMGIQLNHVTVQLDGHVDLAGFQGKDDQAKIGYSEIVTKMVIDADNSDEEIDQFVKFVESRCPALDTLLQSPTVTTTWERQA